MHGRNNNVKFTATKFLKDVLKELLWMSIGNFYGGEGTK